MPTTALTGVTTVPNGIESLKIIIVSRYRILTAVAFNIIVSWYLLIKKGLKYVNKTKK